MDNNTVVALITGPSASGKSTLQDTLISLHNWTKPTNFTTRKPRRDAELDEYVFIDRWTFADKAQLGHFAEWTNYNKQLYAMTRFLDYSRDNAVVVDPIGKGAFEAFLIKSKRRFFRVWVECPEFIREARLAQRRANVLETNERMKDSEWFKLVNPTYDLTVDGTWPAEEAASFVQKYADSIR
jgi:guanylate kinase